MRMDIPGFQPLAPGIVRYEFPDSVRHLDVDFVGDCATLRTGTLVEPDGYLLLENRFACSTFEIM